MNRIVKTFERLGKEEKKAFIPFITLGYPTVEDSEKLIFELERCGADIIELGIPFSDPLADGPVIQTASFEALKNGVNLKKALKFVERIRQKTDIPLIFMGYYNPVLQFGEKEFVKRAAASGVDGIIVADLPCEEATSLKKYAKEADLALIFLLTPVSSDERIKLISKSSEGFVYCVSYTGVTGDEKRKKERLSSLITKIRSFSSIPVAVGFGISSPEDAKKISRLCDGVVVGSAIIRKIMENKNRKDMIKKVGDFVLSLCRAVKDAN